MDTKRIVFAKFAAINAAKTSLSRDMKGRKINLSLSDDLSTTTAEVSDGVQEIRSELNAGYQLVRNFISQLPDLDALKADLKKYEIMLQEVLELAETAADELGADPEVIPNYNAAEVFMNRDIPVMMDLIDSYESKVGPLYNLEGF